MPETLSALHVLEYGYTRSVGPALTAFFTALRDRHLVGSRMADGRVVVPPMEADPVTGDAYSEIVDVADSGVVTTWSWVAEPLPKHPLQRPFAWALVCPDGADTGMLHVVDPGSAERMHTGMRVRARWADETTGFITDIACFVPEDDPAAVPAGASPGAATGEALEPVTDFITPIRLEYDYTPGDAQSRFLRAVSNRRILGMRAPGGKVYVPPRGSDPTTGEATTEEVEVADRGIITMFCIVNVPFLGQAVPPPYVCALVLLDGADIAFQHLVSEVDPADVRAGMRIEAVWVGDDEMRPTMESVKYFRPTGEPDVPYAQYAAAVGRTPDGGPAYA